LDKAGDVVSIQTFQPQNDAVVLTDTAQPEPQLYACRAPIVMGDESYLLIRQIHCDDPRHVAEDLNSQHNLPLDENPLAVDFITSSCSWQHLLHFIL